MSQRRFTGERLHEGEPLFAVDLARHRAAYELALPHAGGARVLDLGSGTGHGAAHLAGAGGHVLGVDRVAPDAAHRGSARFLRADLHGLPLRERSFDLVVSFQVIEHLEDPTVYLDAIARLLRREGLAILTTPNRLTSDGVNPYHVHEYEADELSRVLSRHFAEVEISGLGMSEAVRDYMVARSARIQRIMRLDPLGLRNRLPRAWLERVFAALALRVRRRTRADEGAPDVSWRDFPVGPADPDCIDLAALCRRPR